jgi:hypothetical protein
MAKKPAPELVEAFNLIKDGQKTQAGVILKTYIAQNKLDAQAWWLMAHAVSNAETRQRCLETVLKIDPSHEKARAQLAALTKQAPAAAPPASDQMQASVTGESSEDDFPSDEMVLARITGIAAASSDDSAAPATPSEPPASATPAAPAATSEDLFAPSPATEPPAAVPPAAAPAAASSEDLFAPTPAAASSEDLFAPTSAAEPPAAAPPAETSEDLFAPTPADASSEDLFAPLLPNRPPPRPLRVMRVSRRHPPHRDPSRSFWQPTTPAIPLPGRLQTIPLPMTLLKAPRLPMSIPVRRGDTIHLRLRMSLIRRRTSICATSRSRRTPEPATSRTGGRDSRL